MFKKNKTNNLQFPFSEMVSGNEETKMCGFPESSIRREKLDALVKEVVPSSETNDEM